MLRDGERELSVQELQPGQTLSRSVYVNGSRLLMADTVLGNEEIQKLRRWEVATVIIQDQSMENNV
jgi:hypothetical protein